MTAKKAKKETVYLDQEDDISSVIDKLRQANAKVVALVLPKRYGTLQSIINLKLLKKSAKSAKKSIVLITSDKTVLPMAGTAGIHVAKTLQSKPKIPTVKKAKKEEIMVESEVSGKDTGDEPVLDPKASIGSLTKDEAEGTDDEPDKTDETIDVGDHKTDKKAKSDKKKPAFKIPDFNKFRLRLILGAVLLVLLGVGWFFATKVLPRAKVTVSTNTSKVESSIDFRIKSGLEEVNLEEKTIPAYKFEAKKSSVEKVPTTGEKDVGNKAAGTLTLTNCIKDNEGFVVPAGTIFSAGGLNFTTDEAVELQGALYDGSSCASSTFGRDVEVPVTAAAGGSKYNLSARGYSVPADYTSEDGALLATGSDMAGGTTKIVKIVTEDDIKAATQQALDRLSEEALPELSALFSADQGIGLTGTLENEKPNAAANPKVNKEADEVEVTVNVTFTMYGFKRESITKLIEQDVNDKIDTANQSIQNTGLDDADVKLLDTVSDGEYRASVQTTVVAGPNLDVAAITQEIAGKKLGETTENISSRAGVDGVDVKYSPFWVFSTPNDITKIEIVLVESSNE